MTDVALPRSRNRGGHRGPRMASSVVVARPSAPGLTARRRSTAAVRRARATSSAVPPCESQSVASSDTPAANAVRAEIRRRLEQNQSEAEITDYFVSRYGEASCSSRPRTGIGALVWIVPVVAVIIAFVGIGFRFRGPATRAGYDDRARSDDRGHRRSERGNRRRPTQTMTASAEPVPASPRPR